MTIFSEIMRLANFLKVIFSNRKTELMSKNIATMRRFNAYEIYQKTAIPLMLLGPSIAVIILSFLISLKVSSATKLPSPKTRRRDRQAVLQLMLIVASFLIGYVPYIGEHCTVLILS